MGDLALRGHPSAILVAGTCSNFIEKMGEWAEPISLSRIICTQDFWEGEKTWDRVSTFYDWPSGHK